MKKTGTRHPIRPAFTTVYSAAVASLLGCAVAARADVGPPISIKMPPERAQAISGIEYHSEFVIVLYERGMVSDVRLVGHGWSTVSIDSPPPNVPLDAGTLRIPFRAIPQDANEPIALELKFNGRLTRRQYRVGPSAFAAKGKPRALIAANALQNKQEAAPPHPHAGGADGPTPHGGTLTVQGRIVYDRIGIDRSEPPDGDFVDPGDTPAMTVGADMVLVELWDVDTTSADDLMWRGLTDEFGRFVTSVLDPGEFDDGSPPDLKLIVFATRFDETGIIDPNEDDFYFWETPEIPDFSGSTHNYGTLQPQNAADHPALHIYNSIVRAGRFISEKPGYSSQPVRVVWPVAEWSHYQSGPQEIHIFEDHSWDEDTAVHEFGHHFIHGLHTPPPPDYDNGICDAGSPEGDCFPNGGTWQSTLGHCGWCRESFTDAWNEGWPNWLADVVLRDFPTRYQVDTGGLPYQALFARNYESTNLCCVDNMAHNPLRTEGFVAALLRDIDDATHDDHDGDGIRDLLCLGPNPIFYTLAGDLPTTAQDFINAFLARYPQQTGKLWATAFNVGGAAFVSSFPADAQPPGLVTVCNSSTHPLGVGGALPCMRFEWEPAPDDARGATSYSFAISTTVGGVEPDEIAEQIYETSDCKLAGVTGWGSPASLYFSIKACDAAGNWSQDWSVFGPFSIVDCNGSGFLDLCDLACQSDGTPDCSFGGVCFFAEGVGCGLSIDCNGNYVPDECDIAQGNSADCNRDGIPDECQTAIIKNFIGVESEEWSATANWREGAAPVDGDHVCIPTGTPRTEVFFEEDFRRLATLNCDIDFRLNDTSAELQIDQPSYVAGDLTLTVGSTLRSMTSLDIAGELDWRGHDILGPGTVNVYGGLDLTSPVAVPRLRSSAHLSILNGDVNIHGNEYLELADASSFSIGDPVTYTYDGSSTIFVGTPTTVVNVAGALIRNSGTLNATVNSFVFNSGLIYNRTGNLTLSYGGTHGGEVRGDPGSQLRLNGSHNFLPGSRLHCDDITFGTVGVSSASFVRGNLDVLGALVINGDTFTVTSEADVASYGQHLLVTSGSARLEVPSTGAGVTIDGVTIGDLTSEGSKDARFNTGAPVSFNTLNLIKGDLYGADPITINNSFVWGTGGGSIVAGGAISCVGPATIQGNASSRILFRTFNNAGIATFLGGVSVGAGGSFNNLATGMVELRGNSTGLFGGSCTNAGLIVKTQGTGSASSLNGLNNSGVVRAEIGEIYFSGGGSHSGTILGLPGTLLRFNGTHEMSPASSLTADDIRFFNVAANIRGAVNIADTLTMDGGICTFTNEANVTSYGLHLYLRTGTARFEAPATGQTLLFDTVTIGELSAEGGKVARFNTGQPASINTMNLIEGNIEGVDPITINNSFVWGTGGGSILAGGAITCNGPASIQGNASSRNLFRTFNNSGFATFFGGFSGGSGGNFNNLPPGTVDLRNTGTALGMGTSTTFTNSGMLIKSAGNASTLFTHFRNAGIVDVRAGTLELAGTNGLTHIQTAGSTILNGGVLSITSNTPYQLQGGKLFGVGAITGNILNSAGTIEAGLSIGTLTISGTYSQQSPATMRVEIGGAAPGLFDLIQVGSQVSLAGNLHVQTINGFTPSVGNTFVILTGSAITGTFATLSGTPGFQVSYTPTQVILTAVDSPCPGAVAGDCDGNGMIEPTLDLSCFINALLHSETASFCTVFRSDVNEDGLTNGLDVLAMVNCMVQGCQ